MLKQGLFLQVAAYVVASRHWLAPIPLPLAEVKHKAGLRLETLN